MAYLDDELAAEERHELEAHLTECTSCRSHLDGERADQDVLRKALAAPAAPALLRARISRALDGEDRDARRRWTQYLLPGSAMCAAAAAIAVFVAVRPPKEHVSPVAREAVRQQQRQLPLEVQGPNTSGWVRANFGPALEEDDLVGARLLPHGVQGHDGAKLVYQMSDNGHRFLMKVIAVRDIREEDMADGDEVRIGGQVLHVIEDEGQTAVTYVDPVNHVGYMFAAPEIDANELIGVVGRLVGPR
jgi:hypothetical protein